MVDWDKGGKQPGDGRLPHVLYNHVPEGSGDSPDMFVAFHQGLVELNVALEVLEESFGFKDGVEGGHGGETEVEGVGLGAEQLVVAPSHDAHFQNGVHHQMD